MVTPFQATVVPGPMATKPAEIPAILVGRL
jgi:hypothetical protein